MFWLICQKPERHPHGKKWVSWWPGSGQYEPERIDIRYSHSPRKGIGAFLWIEAETADQAWRYAILKLKAPGAAARWMWPREVHEYPRRVVNMVSYRIGVPETYSPHPTYVHFSDGTFIPIHGLRQEVVKALIDEGVQHEW